LNEREREKYKFRMYMRADIEIIKNDLQQLFIMEEQEHCFILSPHRGSGTSSPFPIGITYYLMR
jgi:hypothetical protein